MHDTLICLFSYHQGINDSIDAVKKLYQNPEDDWLEAIDNLFLSKIIDAIENLK
jgi:hypothetical protein